MRRPAGRRRRVFRRAGGGGPPPPEFGRSTPERLAMRTGGAGPCPGGAIPPRQRGTDRHPSLEPPRIRATKKRRNAADGRPVPRRQPVNGQGDGRPRRVVRSPGARRLPPPKLRKNGPLPAAAAAYECVVPPAAEDR